MRHVLDAEALVAIDRADRAVMRRLAPVDQSLGRRIGHLLAATGGRDVVDAGVAALVADGDEVVTSDPRDLTDLVAATGAHAEIHLV